MSSVSNVIKFPFSVNSKDLYPPQGVGLPSWWTVFLLANALVGSVCMCSRLPFQVQLQALFPFNWEQNCVYYSKNTLLEPTFMDILNMNDFPFGAKADSDPSPVCRADIRTKAVSGCD